MTELQATSERSTLALPLSGAVALRAGVAATALATVWLRTAQSGIPALDRFESHLAYQGWAVVNGTPASPLESSPLVSALQAVVFLLFGANDVLARVVPFLFSVALVFTPFLFRRQLGTWPAFTASLLLAISPLYASSARYLSGESVGLVAGAVALWAVLRYAETERVAYLNAAAAMVAVGWASGPDFHTIWITLAVTAGLYALTAPAPAAVVGEARAAVAAAWKASGYTPLLVLAAVFVPAATFAFFRLDGLGAGLTGGLNLWLQRFVAPGAYPLWPIALLSEPLAIAAGIAGAVLAIRRGEADHWRVIVLWAGVSAVMLLFMRGRATGDVMVSIYALALLAAYAASALAARVAVDRELLPHHAALGAFVLLLVIALLALVHPPSPEMPERFADIRSTYLLGQTVLTGAIALLLLMLAVGEIRALGASGVGLTLGALALVLLGLVSVRTSAELRFGYADLWRGSVGRGVTSTDLRTLGDYLRRLGSTELGMQLAPRQVVVAESLADDLVWYLRGATGVRYGIDLARVSETSVLVEPASGGLGAGGYAADERRFRLSIASKPELRIDSDFPASFRWERLIRWIIFRETAAVAETENVVVRGTNLD